MPHKLLLADDSVTIQRVIELTFADEDVQVIAVGDGRKAIERIEADRPDIVLADVGMPERDGYEVAAFVKNTAHLAHIPVLLLTGAFEPVDEQRASAVGCDGVLAKPFEPHMVITRVRELLAGGVARRVPERAPDAVVEPPAPAAADAGEGAGQRVWLARADLAEGPVAPSEFTPAAEVPPMAAQAADAALRISRRTPIAVPGFGSPAPPSESQVAAVDEYFDRLDAAFATLQQPPVPAADSGAAPPVPAGDAFAEAPAGEAPEPAAGQEPPAAAREVVEQAAVAAPTAAPAPRAPSQVPGIAQAFSALFAAERGETAVEIPSFIGPAALPQASVDDLVERVTRQVLERLSDRVVRDTVTDLVSRVAERLVRDEIERVKATLK
jgi:CheY-like chemotaxis protein